MIKIKNLNVKTAKNLWDDANKGFSAAGKTGNTIEAGYHRVVRDVLRKQIDKVAPGFEKGTKLIRQGLQKEKLLKTVREGLQRQEIRTGLKPTEVPISGGLKFLKGAGSSVAKTAGSMALFKLLGF